MTVLIMNFGEEDVIESTQESIAKYQTDREETSDKVDTMVSDLDNAGRINTTQINKIRNKIINGVRDELKVYYRAAESYDANGNPTTVKVEGRYNGGLEDQTFTQYDIGAYGGNVLTWHVLSVDDKGVNIVSDPTRVSVKFKDSSGYDNCLYYLNEICTQLFTNEEEFGVDESRVHPLRFSDIKYAAEQINEGYEVVRQNGTKEKWSWDYDFIRNAPCETSGTKAYNNGQVGQQAMTTAIKYFPKIYKTHSDNDLKINNLFYDEIPNKLVADDEGIMREDSDNPASTFEANYTYDSYYNNKSAMITNLGPFGSSRMGTELFNYGGNAYYLASRCIRINGTYAYYHLRTIRANGELDTVSFCLSNGNVYEQNNKFRVVVSIPPEHIKVSPTGVVTIV